MSNKKQSKPIKKQRILQTVNHNCIVQIQSKDTNKIYKITISPINGYDQYVYIIGKKTNDTVKINNELFTIISIVEFKRKVKSYLFRTMKSSNPLNNSVHHFKTKK